MKFLVITTAVLSIICHSTSASARSDDKIEEIFVTATKRSTNLMKTPVAITALMQSELSATGVNNLLDVTNLVPNLELGHSFEDSGIRIAMRGISSNNFTEIGDPAVGLHVDGIYSPRPQGALALLYDVDRIEILRGPQGTLFGRNSTVGVINIIPARPNFERIEGSIEFEYGNYDHKKLRGVLNIPLSEDLAIRASFMIDDRDGYITQEMDLFDFEGDGIPNTDQRRNHPVDKDDYYTNSEQWAARLTALWNPTEDLEVLLAYEHFDDNGAGGMEFKDCQQYVGTFQECQHETRWANVNVPGKLDMTIDSVRLRLRYDIADYLQVEYKFGYADQERSQDVDADGGHWAHPSESGIAFTGRFLPWEDVYLGTIWSDYESTTHEIQIKSIDDGKFQWLAGGFFLDEHNAIRFDIDLPACCGIPTPAGIIFIQPDRSPQSKAAFLQLDYRVTEGINLNAGYRHTWDQKQDIGGRTYESFGPWTPGGDYSLGQFDLEGWLPWVNAPPWQSNDLTMEMGTFAEPGTALPLKVKNDNFAKWNKGTWRVGIDYTINQDAFLYMNIATGFKAGGFAHGINTCSPADGGCLTFFEYGPEEVVNYEIGYKWSTPGNRANFKIAAFYADYSDMQVTNIGKVAEFTIDDIDPVTGEEFSKLIEVIELHTSNVASATIKGIEFEFDIRPWEGGKISGFATYLDAKIKDYPDAETSHFCEEREAFGLTACAPVNSNGLRLENLKGNRLPLAPKWAFTLNTSQSFDLDNMGKVTFQSSFHWQSKMYFSANNFDEIPFSNAQNAWININLNVRYETPSQDKFIELYVINLTDELVKNHITKNGPGFIKAAFNPPRMYGVRVGYSF